jgi:DUF1680 family protein
MDFPWDHFAQIVFLLHSHELYNVGHLYEAAIAYYRATGKKKLLNVAEKSARHINKVISLGRTGTMSCIPPPHCTAMQSESE